MKTLSMLAHSSTQRRTAVTLREVCNCVRPLGVVFHALSENLHRAVP